MNPDRLHEAWTKLARAEEWRATLPDGSCRRVTCHYVCGHGSLPCERHISLIRNVAKMSPLMLIFTRFRPCTEHFLAQKCAFQDSNRKQWTGQKDKPDNSAKLTLAHLRFTDRLWYHCLFVEAASAPCFTGRTGHDRITQDWVSSRPLPPTGC